jgi:hypothetical protein
MKKKSAPKKYTPAPKKETMLNEPVPSPVYRGVKALPQIADFPYRQFAKIAERVPFTQKEWAAILHLSEKTLQRYAKDNTNFEGIYVDRILQMQELIESGLTAFRSPDAFYRWLKRDKPVLGHLINFDSLKTHEGIRLITDETVRIMHGVYI